MVRPAALVALVQMPDLRALDAYLDGLGGKDATLREGCRRAVAALRDRALPTIETRADRLCHPGSWPNCGRSTRIMRRPGGAGSSPWRRRRWRPRRTTCDSPASTPANRPEAGGCSGSGRAWPARRRAILPQATGPAPRPARRQRRVDVRRAAHGTDPLGLHQFHDALLAHRKADGRRRLAAELRDQPVVATAGADGVLRAQCIGDPLEHRARVVVEAAHQARIDDVVDAHGARCRAQPVEMRRATRRRGARSAAARPTPRPASPGSCCRGCAADCRPAAAGCRHRARRHAAGNTRPACRDRLGATPGCPAN